MKFFAAAIFILIFSLTVSAENSDAGKNEASGINKQSPADAYDGNELYNPGDGGKQMRAPNSGDLPYSDDEIQNNSPENYKTKNMPVDQD